MQRELFEAETHRKLEEDLMRKKAQREGAVPPSELDQDGRGLLPFVIQEVADGSNVTGRGGLPLVVEVLRGYRADDLIKKYVRIKLRARGYTDVELAEGLVLLQASGGEHLEDMQVLKEDEGLCRLLNRTLPSPDAERSFLLGFHDEALLEAARQLARERGERSYVPEESEGLKGLFMVHAELMRRMAQPSKGTTATLDHDATVIDSYKQTATWHYKGARGYQPAVVYWAEQDLVVADEFRDGNVPAGTDNLRLIKRSFAELPEWVLRRAFRADSACYEECVLKWLADDDRTEGPKGKIDFTISADMTPQLRALCQQVQEPDSGADADVPRWQMLDETRADETVEWAEVEFTPGNWHKDALPLRYLVVRFIRRQGKLFSTGDREKYLAVVTNRTGAGDEIICGHWQKAGTIEHVHDETKNGLGGGVLPCAEFGANAAWYRFAMLTYNALSVIKQHALPTELQKVKAKRLRFLVFNLAATISVHARTLISHMGIMLLHRVGIRQLRALLKSLRRQVAFVPTG